MARQFHRTTARQSGFNAAFNHQILMAANEDQMFNVVAAQQDKPAGLVDVVVFQNTKA